MKKLIFPFFLLVTLASPAYSQDEPKVKADWKIVASAKSYYVFIDMNLIKETDKNTLVAFQMRHARTDTREGQLAKQSDYASISKIIGAQRAKKVSHEVSLIEVNCEEYKHRDLRMWLEDEKGNSVFDFPAKQLGKWVTSARESISGKVIEAVCAASKDQ